MIKKCEVCGKEFFTTANYKTCSMECRGKSNWKKNIQKAMKLRNIRDSKNPRWKYGKSRGYILKKAKEGWIKKDLPYLCEKCGLYKKKLIYHHIDKNNQNNIPENVLLICYSCHNLIHDRGKKGDTSLNGKKCIICNKELRGKQRIYCSYECLYKKYYTKKYNKIIKLKEEIEESEGVKIDFESMLDYTKIKQLTLM